MTTESQDLDPGFVVSSEGLVALKRPSVSLQPYKQAFNSIAFLWPDMQRLISTQGTMVITKML